MNSAAACATLGWIVQVSGANAGTASAFHCAIHVMQTASSNLLGLLASHCLQCDQHAAKMMRQLCQATNKAVLSAVSELCVPQCHIDINDEWDISVLNKFSGVLRVTIQEFCLTHHVRISPEWRQHDTALKIALYPEA
jgi:hypothetical protein